MPSRRGPNSKNGRLWAHQNGRCCYCGRQMVWCKGKNRNADHSATREHLKKIADGGTHDIGNMALSCKLCNSQRGNRSWLEWKTIRMGEAI